MRTATDDSTPPVVMEVNMDKIELWPTFMRLRFGVGRKNVGTFVAHNEVTNAFVFAYGKLQDPDKQTPYKQVFEVEVRQGRKVLAHGYAALCLRVDPVTGKVYDRRINERSVYGADEAWAVFQEPGRLLPEPPTWLAPTE